MKVNVYSIKDKGVEIFRGTNKEISEHFNTGQINMKMYTKGNLLFQRKYTVEETDEVRMIQPRVKRLVFNKEKPKKPTTVDYLYRHLVEYGNTVLNNDPEKYRDELKNLGVEFTSRKVKTDFGNRKTYFYVLERV